MVADRHDVRPRLIDAAVDHALGVELHRRRRDRLGIERELQNVGRLDQARRARAREQIATGIGRMAHADMAERIEHAFVRQYAVGKRDLVAGIGEIIGGSQREDDYDKLRNRMQELGLKEDDYKFYLDLRKYGSTRHAGFGLGFERCVMYLTGMGNIRDVIPFPRTVNNCDL